MSASDIGLYRFAEAGTELLLGFMCLFGPWAFGTTQTWSIWTMNTTAYALGLLLLIKLGLRRFKGYNPPRWEPPHPRAGTERTLTIGLALLTVSLLAYCLVSALNARATYHEEIPAFEYRSCIGWLPHSFDAAATWSAFWTYFGLACVFWATRDWLLGKTTPELRAGWQAKIPAPGLMESLPLPGRLRRLLWLLALNGAALGIEAILQRLAGSPRLLFIIEPRIHKTAATQFGPYAYRANAAQYFNLLWPVCLGLWWTLHRHASPGRKAHHALLVCTAIMAACPWISTSRGGALITLAQTGLIATWLLVSRLFHRLSPQPFPHTRNPTFAWLALCLAATVLLALGLGWRALAPRLEQLDDGFAGRALMSATARPMAQDFPLFGTGPGTFETVSYLYPRPEMFWPAQLHNDWLEMRITFGLLGSAMLGLGLAAVAVRWFAGSGIRCAPGFLALTWLALAGCLAHARYDFPLQIYSIEFVFVILCAVLFTVSKRGRAPAELAS